MVWWLEYLQEFTFDVQHHKGKLLGNADPLSKYPETVKDDEQHMLCFLLRMPYHY